MTADDDQPPTPDPGTETDDALLVFRQILLEQYGGWEGFMDAQSGMTPYDIKKRKETCPGNTDPDKYKINTGECSLCGATHKKQVDISDTPQPNIKDVKHF